jgi:hypothetical protein
MVETPSASRRLRTESSNSHGNVHTGATTSQNSVAKPKPDVASTTSAQPAIESATAAHCR